MFDRLSIAAAENAKLDRIDVMGTNASNPGLLTLIFLGTMIVSPGKTLRSPFPANTFLPCLTTRPFALIM